jgi:plastocyanin
LWGILLPVAALAALTVWLALSAPVSARLEGEDAGDPLTGTSSTASAVADGNYTLTVSAEPDGVAVMPGDLVTYTIQFVRQGGSEVTSGVLTHRIPSLVRPLGIEQVSFETVGGVNPQRLRFRNGVLRWQGQLGPNAGMRIVYPARVQSVVVITLDIPPPLTSTFTAEVLTTDGFAQSASVDTTITGAEPLDPDKVDLTLDYYDRGDLTWLQDHFVPGTDGFLRIEATNTNSQPAVLGLFGIFPSRNIVLQPLRSGDQAGWTGNFATSVEGETRELSFNIGMPPGATLRFDLPVRSGEDLPAEAELVSRLGYCITDGGLACPGAPKDQPQASPAFDWLPPVTVTVKYRDLGDAPDSTNHAAAAMTAYPAVQAEFPTVFDPATGAVQGPAHLNPRPFHLGRRFTPEAEADVGPDLDPSNNIEPALNVPNRDRRDDGVPANLLSFQDCQATNVPVRVAIRPAAVNYFQQQDGKGYLNVWLDGNRDGDWADSTACPPVEGQPSVALEHIVIDYEVDVVALGAGLHTLVLPTGRVPWASADQSAWLRVTLSDRPSNKPLSAGGIAYGDGRGYATPFVLGETEDYLYVPQDAPEAGPDVVVEQQARWQAAAGDLPGVLAAAAPLAWQQRLGTLTLQIRYQNVGNQTAEDVTLKSFVNEKLKDAVIDITTVPEVDYSRTVEPEDVFIFDLGDLLPGTIGTAVEEVEFKCPPYCCLTCVLRMADGLVAHPDLVTVEAAAGTEAPANVATVAARQVFTNAVTIESGNDVNPDNNRSQVEQEVLPAPLSLGFTYPGGEHLVRSGTTCNSTSYMLGQALNRYYLGQSLNVIVDGTPVGTVDVDDTGRFFYTLELDDGWHRVGVDLPADQFRRLAALSPVGTSPSWTRLAQYKYGTAAIRINVDSSLPWNPISLTFTDQEGNVIRPSGGGAGGQDASGWTAQLQPGGSYQMSLAYCGADPSPTLKATFAGQEVELTDPDGDDIYQGLIVMPDPAAVSQAVATESAVLAPLAVPLELSIRSGAVEAIYQGALAEAASNVVYDASTGESVTGAQVTALESNGTPAGAALFDAWPAEDYGQTNPQATGSDGAFGFWAPAGLYRLSVERQGYQSYRSWDMSIVDDLLAEDVPLTPLVNGPADQIIEIDGDGFDPPWIRVAPGSIVRWVNVDVTDHTATSIQPALAGPGTLQLGAWDSGVLSSGDAYTLTVETEGTYTYGDRANRSNTAAILVAPDNMIYLPLLLR